MLISPRSTFEKLRERAFDWRVLLPQEMTELRCLPGGAQLSRLLPRRPKPQASEKTPPPARLPMALARRSKTGPELSHLIATATTSN